jgi:hypothetical protein
LDNVLRTGLGVSYYDGSACHLDLVQWATDPVWGKIPSSAAREALLEDGVPHLRAQLTRENVRLVLLNGRQVIDQVTSLGLAELIDIRNISLGRQPCRLLLGTGRGVRWLGWSTNLQSSWGVSAALKRQLAYWVASATDAGRGTDTWGTAKGSVTLGYLALGERFDSKCGLVRRLERWRVNLRRRPSAT